MSRSLLVVLPLLAACLNHATPIDRSIEHTGPFELTAGAMPTELPARLHVVTFNLHMEPGAKILRGLRGDPALRDADVFILQEVHRIGDTCSTACVIARELGYYAVYAPGHVNGDGTDGVAIVSRAPIASARVIELPPHDVVFNGGRRIAMAATIQLAGAPVTIYAVHLENRLTVAQRLDQMAPVVADAERQTTPVIIAGDLNTSPFTWLGHVVPVPTGTQDDHMEAFVRAHGFATPVIASGPTHHHLWMKLDAIYTRGLTTWEFATATAGDVSDHLALWAKMYPSTS
jgi:endonuclease/exonuclease/phosphatase family metal-dependent hydrolase